MGIYGDIAKKAYRLVTGYGRPPQDAWGAALSEHYTAAEQLRNAIKHTCPKGAFLGLCQNGFLRGIAPGHYTNSVRSRHYAHAAVVYLRADPSLATNKSRLKTLVYKGRSPNGELDVVLAFWAEGLIN